MKFTELSRRAQHVWEPGEFYDVDAVMDGSWSPGPPLSTAFNWSLRLIENLNNEWVIFRHSSINKYCHCFRRTRSLGLSRSRAARSADACSAFNVYSDFFLILFYLDTASQDIVTLWKIVTPCLSYSLGVFLFLLWSRCSVCCLKISFILYISHLFTACLLSV